MTVASLAFLASCSLLPKKEVVKNTLPEGAWWSHGPSEGSHKIVISLEEQRVALFRGQKPVGVSPISSGREGHSTHSGTYRVTEKDPDHRSSIYGAYVDERGAIVVEDVDVRKDPKPPGTTFLGADMQHFMRINGAIGMHRGYLPGYPASHGCIRLPGTMAALFYSATPEGTPVEITDHADLASLQPAPEAENVTVVESKTDFSKTQPLKVAEPEATQAPEATKAEPPPAGSGRTWFASATKKSEAPLSEPAAAEKPKSAPKKSWLASLALPELKEPSAGKPVEEKVVSIKKPRLEPEALPPTSVYAPESKVVRPKAIVMEAPKAKPLPKSVPVKASKKSSPKPGQTLYWNGN
jgi:L,D-transpeptidase catalytic domain